LVRGSSLTRATGGLMLFTHRGLELEQQVITIIPILFAGFGKNHQPSAGLLLNLV
jgi:hypothetical protein